MMIINKSTLLKIFLSLLAFLLVLFFSVNFMLNYFYTYGGYVLDQGWFAYLSIHAQKFLFYNPKMIGGVFFNYHISPIFYVFSFFYKVLSLLGIHLAYPTFFSLTEGLWFGLISLASFYFFISSQRDSKLYCWLAFFFSLLVAINGLSLALIGSMHIEIAIPAMLFLFFVFWLNDLRNLGYLCVAVGLLIREDAGFYYGSIFFALAAFFYFFNEKPCLKRYAKNYLFIAAACFIYCFSVSFFQRINFGSHLLTSIYLGAPPFHHLSFDFVVKRLQEINHHTLYVYVPYFWVVILSIIRKDIFLILAPLALLPYVVFTFFAIHTGSGSLSGYHAFPLFVVILWPAITYRFLSKIEMLSRSYRSYFFDACFTIFISFLLFALLPHSDPPNMFEKHWSAAGIQWVLHKQENINALNAFVQKNIKRHYLVFDDATAALELDSIDKKNYFSNVINQTLEEKRKIDFVVFEPYSPSYKNVQQLLRDAGLTHIQRLGVSSYYVASREKE